ncbi:LysR substrate binding domain protein [compost metagenome]
MLEHYDHWHFSRGAQALEVAIKGNVTSNSSEAIREMVIGGLGISLSPEWLFAADIEQGNVCSLLDDYQTTSLPVSAVFSRERRRSARTLAFIDFLRKHL